VTAFVHVDGAKSKAENVKLTRLPRALPVAFTVDHLFVVATFSHLFSSLHGACSFVVDGALWANRCANVALGHDEAGRARGEPLVFALLASLALFNLAVASPKGKRLLAAKVCPFKELGAGEEVGGVESMGEHFVVGKILGVGGRLTLMSSLSSAGVAGLRLILLSSKTLAFCWCTLATLFLATLSSAGRRHVSVVDRVSRRCMRLRHLSVRMGRLPTGSRGGVGHIWPVSRLDVCWGFWVLLCGLWQRFRLTTTTSLAMSSLRSLWKLFSNSWVSTRSTSTSTSGLGRLGLVSSSSASHWLLLVVGVGLFIRCLFFRLLSLAADSRRAGGRGRSRGTLLVLRQIEVLGMGALMATLVVSPSVEVISIELIGVAVLFR